MGLAANFQNETRWKMHNIFGGMCVYIHVENARLFQLVLLNYHMWYSQVYSLGEGNDERALVKARRQFCENFAHSYNTDWKPSC